MRSESQSMSQSGVELCGHGRRTEVLATMPSVPHYRQFFTILYVNTMVPWYTQYDQIVPVFTWMDRKFPWKFRRKFPSKMEISSRFWKIGNFLCVQCDILPLVWGVRGEPLPPRARGNLPLPPELEITTPCHRIPIDCPTSGCCTFYDGIFNYFPSKRTI